ncbi:MAG: TraR/DksA family transcriptional regulator [Acidobacteria bacterium]|nr:TraR/DksA family transcriptional regulator [Acidobacteriota bacterium]
MRTNVNDEGLQDRYYELKRILDERRLEIIGEVQSKMRAVRDEDAVISRQCVRDEAETCELDIQDDIEFALLQMKAETLEKISEALARLEQGHYGHCYECGTEISERRLRALPFAVRCRDCEEAREIARQRERILDGHNVPASMFTDMHG